MKKKFSLGFVAIILTLTLIITYAVSEKPKEDAIKIANDLLHQSIEQITSN